jgi:hypothetical protein
MATYGSTILQPTDDACPRTPGRGDVIRVKKLAEIAVKIGPVKKR